MPARYLMIGVISGLMGSLGEWAGLDTPVCVLMVILTAVIWSAALFSRPQP